MSNSSNLSPIRLDESGIFLNGRYRILLASSLFYFRIPKECWERRMRLLKAAGYNTIDVYFPWNYHETSPGIWNFTGQRDVTQFLSLAAKNDLFVIARPGPYICSEWDGGALPAWLWADNVPVRQDNPAFLAQIEHWYKQILPLIIPFQITRGGPVICMQIENELDFFDCKSPVSYMEKLMQQARALGIDIPLFYCCGQNDLLRGGGLTPDLYTAFNVYTSADNAGLEERALHLYHAARERQMPFLVTETNREHSFLKRLLVCGARLISPYNQTAGSTLDWYNGLTNWGTQESPLSLIASDYDFASMIGAAGEVNEEFYEARLLAGLILSLGESLAKSYPKASCDAILNSGSRVYPVPALDTGRGLLLVVSNLDGTAAFTLRMDGQSFPVEMPSLKTRLLPYRLRLSDKPSAALLTSSYEVGFIEESEAGVTVALYGEGPFYAQLQANGRTELLTAAPGTGIQTFRVGSVTVLVGSSKEIALAHIPGLPDLARPVEEQATPYPVSSVRYAVCDLPQAKPMPAPVQPMEKMGQYRGLGCYRFTLEKDSQILLQNVADFFTIEKNGQLLETGFSEGGCLERSLTAGSYAIYTEIWGHSNFDDVRRPSLQMGSLKGLSGLSRIEGYTALNENWEFDIDEQPIQEWYFFRHSNLSTLAPIDGYNRAVMPFHGVYDKWVELPADADCLFLHFGQANGIITVYVNGHREATVHPFDPYVDLSSYCGSARIELCLRITRRFYADYVGPVTLLWGRKIHTAIYETVPVEMLALPAEGCQTGTFPLALPSDRNIVLQLDLPSIPQSEMKLRLEGQNVKITAFHGTREIGRLLLGCPSMPTVAGGDPQIVHLCRNWLEGRDLRFWCQPMGPAPHICKAELTGYQSIAEN